MARSCGPYGSHRGRSTRWFACTVRHPALCGGTVCMRDRIPCMCVPLLSGKTDVAGQDGTSVWEVRWARSHLSAPIGTVARRPPQTLRDLKLSPIPFFQYLASVFDTHRDQRIDFAEWTALVFALGCPNRPSLLRLAFDLYDFGMFTTRWWCALSGACNRRGCRPPRQSSSPFVRLSPDFAAPLCPHGPLHTPLR